MSRRKKPKAIQPDEFFSKGPLSVARFGKNVVFQSDWPEGAFAEAQEQLLNDYPKVVQEIDQLVSAIAHPKIVSERLGHSNIAITLDTYSHVLPGMQESAIEALDASLAAAIESDG